MPSAAAPKSDRSISPAWTRSGPSRPTGRGRSTCSSTTRASRPETGAHADGFELQFGTNHLGHFALTNLLLMHVTGRVVTLGSQAERVGRIDLEDPQLRATPYKRSTSYNQSKLANILFRRRAPAPAQRRGIPGCSAQTGTPGFVATEIYSDSGPVAGAMVRLLSQGPDQGALPVLYAALGEIPRRQLHRSESSHAHARGARAHQALVPSRRCCARA